MLKLRTIRDVNFQGKCVLLRADLNVPVKDGKVQDSSRLEALLPTLKYLIDKAAKIIILSHFGRPKGEVVESLRLYPVAKELECLLGTKIQKVDDCIGEDVNRAVSRLRDGEVLMLENTRFHPEETVNDPIFTAALAELGEIFVNDAFGTAHRAHSSTLGLAELLPSYAGFLVENEVKALQTILESPVHPVCLLLGGAKIDTKIGILESFLAIADVFLIGGALANTFLAAKGFEVGTSLCESDKIEVAKKFLDDAMAQNVKVLLPIDALVADEINKDVKAEVLPVDSVGEDMKILDIGPESSKHFIEEINNAKTIIWNGPMGLYELPQFLNGTKNIANAVAASDAVTVVGGGDSLDAIKAFGLKKDQFTHISTGGGAMLEFLEGKVIPALAPLFDA